MKATVWQIDNYNRVTLKHGIFGRFRVYVNDQEVATKILWRKTIIPIFLLDGRKGEIFFTSNGFIPDIELRIDGKLLLAEKDKKELICIKCGATTKFGAKFCEKCGSEFPSAENHLRLKKLKEATNAVGIVAAMFFIFGAIMFFIQKAVVAKTMQNLARFNDGDILPALIQGKQYTAGELRQSLQWQPMGLLVTNTILALIMFGLYKYAKKSPFVALLTATAIYAVVIVVNMIVSPTTANQGLVMKIFMLGLLIKGVRTALELRKISA